MAVLDEQICCDTGDAAETLLEASEGSSGLASGRIGLGSRPSTSRSKRTSTSGTRNSCMSQSAHALTLRSVGL